MRKSSANNFVSVSFQSNWEVSFNWKQIVQENNVVLATCDQESTIRGKINIADVSTVSSFVLFYKNQRLETSIETTALVHRKTLLLTNCQHFSIRTENSPSHRSFKVELSDYKVPLQVEYSRVTWKVNGYKGGSIWRNGNERSSMRILNG